MELHIGVELDDPVAPVHTLNDKVLNVGIVTANQIHAVFMVMDLT